MCVAMFKLCPSDGSTAKREIGQTVVYVATDMNLLIDLSTFPMSLQMFLQNGLHIE